MNIHHLVVGALGVNCYLLVDPVSHDACLIDPGDNAADILHLIERSEARVSRIINTHAHFDHVLAIPAVQQATGAAFHLHKADLPVLAYAPQAVATWLGETWGPPPTVDQYLAPGDDLRLGDTQLEIRHAPGHSPGSVLFVDHAGRRAWVGDVIFAGSIGRTDIPGANFDQLIASIHSQVLTLPDDYTLYPGHGPATTVGRERRTNPFLA